MGRSFWRVTAVGAAVVALGVMPLAAETLQERVAAAQRRWTEYQELMDSSDPIARAEAFNAALADDNLGVRNNALWAYLQHRNRLPIDVVAEPGGRVGPGDLPKTALSEVKWNAEQRALDAMETSFNDRQPVSGLVVSGKLQLVYRALMMPDAVGHAVNSTTTGSQQVRRRCDTVLALNAARDALEGRLACEGMSQTLPLRMPLG